MAKNRQIAICVPKPDFFPYPPESGSISAVGHTKGDGGGCRKKVIHFVSIPFDNLLRPPRPGMVIYY